MKKSILLVACVLTAFAAAAQPTEQNPFPSYVDVTGTAEQEVEPNEIYLGITINEVDTKGKITVEEMERRMIATLRSIGIDPKTQLTVADMTSSRYRKKQAATVKNYQLKLTDTAQASDVYYALQDAGITNIDLLRLTRSDLQELRAGVRTKAMQNARQTASELAAAVGQTIGKAFYIQYYNRIESPIMRAANASMNFTEYAADQATGGSEPLGFQKIRLTASVSARFVLE